MRCSTLYWFSIKYLKTLKISLGGPNIWQPFREYKTRIFCSIVLLFERFSKSYLSSLEKWVVFLPKVSLCVQFIFLFKTLKNIKKISLYVWTTFICERWQLCWHYMCEPFLFVKDDNCVDKEYEEANEQNIIARRWGCIFCWSKRTVSHDGLRRPCYLAHGRAIGGWNQHWKKRIGITNFRRQQRIW